MTALEADTVPMREPQPTAGLQDAFEAALRSADPKPSLRQLVKRLLDGPTTREEIADALESYRISLREQGRDADEDVILEVMDELSGWASPHAKL